ncbi:unnamed protein product [Effrenium voratum]|nr:unnamed protein product [Effrenium voratum]
MEGFAESLVTYGSLERSTEAEGFRAAPFIAEFVGTFILVFTFGCVALSTAHLFWKPTAVACVVTVMIYSTATVSGGHLNPAVSLALTLQGVLPLCRMLGFWLVQLAGGVCAALTLRAMMGDGQILLRSMLPVMPYNLALVMLAELLYTALLCFLVSCCLVSKRNNPRGDHSQSFGLAIGLLYVAGNSLVAQHRVHILNKRWAAAMLALGAVCGLVAMALATLAGTFNSISGFEMKPGGPEGWDATGGVGPGDPEYACFEHRVCPSGRSYHAETVSEMVSRSNFPAAKLFFSFTLIGSIALLLSRYPWELRNVYTGGSPKMRLLTATRAVLPPIGMLIVCTIPVVPRVNRTDLATKLACNVHSFGACLYVGGYNALEICTLRVLWYKLDRSERWLRSACVALGLFCTASFLIIGALYSSAAELGICCVDKYEASVKAFEDVYHLDNRTGPGLVEEHLISKTYGPYVLVDSAYGLALLLKKLEFWFEEFSGLFVIMSHLLIWKFCRVQHLDVPEVVEIA